MIPAQERMKAASKPGDDTRLTPDPFSAVLPALAALGALTSIATVNWVAQERTSERTGVRRKANAVLRDLESCCVGLQEIFRRFERHPKLFAGQGKAAASPLKFGVHGLRNTPDEARLDQKSMDDIASRLVLATQNSFDVMSAIEDGEIDAPEELFFGFGEQQERLNGLLTQRATLKTCVETGLSVAEQLTALVRGLRRHRVE